jgi:hypothetical protein
MLVLRGGAVSYERGTPVAGRRSRVPAGRREQVHQWRVSGPLWAVHLSRHKWPTRSVRVQGSRLREAGGVAERKEEMGETR